MYLPYLDNREKDVSYVKHLNVRSPAKLIKSTGSNGPFMLVKVVEGRILYHRWSV